MANSDGELEFIYSPAQIRGLYRIAASVYWTGMAFLISAAILGLVALVVDSSINSSHYDLQMRRVVYSSNSTMQRVQTLSIIAAVGLAAIALLLQIGGAVTFLILLYRCWEVISDGRARTAPKTAVGFLFVPLFNLYWVFVAYLGLAQDLNKYIRRHRLDAPFASPALPLAFCVYAVVGFIPVLGQAGSLLNLFILPLMFRSFARSATGILQAWDERGEEQLPTLPPKTANAGTIAALVLAPIGLVLLSFGLLFGYTAFDDMARYQNYNRTDSEELTDLKSRPKTDGRANSRIQQLESDLQRRTEIWFPQYRKRLLLNAILAFVGFLTLAASAALAYFFRPGPRLRAES